MSTPNDDFVFEPEQNEAEPGRLGTNIEKLRERLHAAEAEKKEYLDTLQRLRADYANLRKSEAAAREDAVQFANKALVLELLTLADSFDHALTSSTGEPVDAAWRAGVEQIRSQLETLFRKHGVEAIDPLGEPFDPHTAHCVQLVEVTDPAQDHTVVQVLQKGYTMHKKIIRPASVAVGNYTQQ